MYPSTTSSVISKILAIAPIRNDNNKTGYRKQIARQHSCNNKFLQGLGATL